MRRFSLLLLVAAVSLTGCHFRHDQVKGSGRRAIEKRDISPFTSLSLEGAYNVSVVCQQNLSFEIEADDNILPLLQVEVSNNVLRIKSIKNYSISQPVAVKIGVPNIEGLSVSGAGKIDITGMKNDKFEIDSSGAPTITVSGDTKMVDIDSSGAAKIDAHKLHASRAVVDSKGVSQIDIEVTEHLDVTISGPSSVTYDGDPVVNKTIHGPGKVERKASTGA